MPEIVYSIIAKARLFGLSFASINHIKFTMSDQDTPPPKDDEPPKVEDSPSPGSPSDVPADSSSEPAPEPGDESPPQLEEGSPDAADSEAPVASSNVLGKGKMSENDEKTMGMLAHILGGVTCFLGPLIIWLIKKDESPFVDDQGKEALNFQISVLIAYVAAGIIGVIPVVGCLSALLIPAIGIAALIFAILGGLEANKGIIYRYPFALRLIS